MNKYHVSLAGFSFTAFERASALPEAVTVQDVQPTFEGGDVEERGGRKIRNPRVIAGTPVRRTVLEVEAHSQGDAEGVFKRACGIKNTSAEFKIEEIGGGVAVLDEPPAKGKRGGKTAADLLKE